jgi:hypothetical protein
MAAIPFQAAKNSEMVIVACKIPFGIHLDIPLNDDDCNRVTIAGSSHPQAVCGFGLTRVPKDFYQEWLTRNAELPMVKKGLVFAHKDQRSAEAEATDKRDVKSGFEGLNPDEQRNAGAFKIIPESYDGYSPPKA